MTEAEACRLLARELPPNAFGVRRALRAARYWGTFERAYTAEHHQLGRAVLAAAPEALARFRGAALAAADGQLVVVSGYVTRTFALACLELVECLDREGVLV